MHYLTRAATYRIVECLGMECEEWRANFTLQWTEPVKYCAIMRGRRQITAKRCLPVLPKPLCVPHELVDAQEETITATVDKTTVNKSPLSGASKEGDLLLATIDNRHPMALVTILPYKIF